MLDLNNAECMSDMNLRECAGLVLNGITPTTFADVQDHIELDVTFSAAGFIGPMTDTVTVPESYTIPDVEAAVSALLADVSTAIDRNIILKRILLVKPHR